MTERPAKVSSTAQGVALQRAIEALRPPEDRIVSDEFASIFLAPPTSTILQVARTVGPRWFENTLAMSSITNYVVTRHAALDSRLRVALREGAIQVVLLGAGYDMRAFRLAEVLADRRVIELDLEGTQSRKRRALERAGLALPANLTLQSIDFERHTIPERLRAAGFHHGARTVFIWEGVSMYLPEAAAMAVIKAVSFLAGPGSVLLFDAWAPGSGKSIESRFYDRASAMLGWVGEPVRFRLPLHEAAPWLAAGGLQLGAAYNAHELQLNFGRAHRPLYDGLWVGEAIVAQPPASAV